MGRGIDQRKLLLRIYNKLYRYFGPRHWWPGDTPFEVIIGAILTQNTSWKNVEKAIYNLKRKNLLTPKALYRLNLKELKQLIRPAGFYNIKAVRLKSFVNFLFLRYNDLQTMLLRPLTALRKELLEVKGIGPETAGD